MYGYPSVEHRLVKSRVMLGLFVTLLAASVGTYVGQFIPPVFYMPLVIIEFVMLFAASMVRRRKMAGWGFVLGFTFISGMTLTPILYNYTQMLGVHIVQEAFLITAATFAVTSFIASRKSLDFSWLGQFLFAGILVLVGLSLVNIFVPFSTSFSFGFTYLGIAVFVGYMLFDVNRLTRYGVSPEQVPMVVLQLYLDFVNLFLFILRLFGLNAARSSRD
ncbi:MAG: Bax inhibitor-1/YccA family protein [Acidibacillus sp.]|uniref:Bax inhibitor-1/YccA family protein n=1 Tax=Sulfoacidibacillus ferrooxidans TaxID=2005001 RepID=A0A9X2ACP0_9BACL|nr:Bax inhibitor-1/YccA family protein [Sulfoacidibacillus ferrooxidans]MCI0182515.1 putative protein YetJ [Sulfoacidibacillus ferrooxidans]MCY0894210.1 Bax inhibitor-1/YccA family protein [Acidibacillus sp.]